MSRTISLIKSKKVIKRGKDGVRRFPYLCGRELAFISSIFSLGKRGIV